MMCQSNCRKDNHTSSSERIFLLQAFEPDPVRQHFLLKQAARLGNRLQLGNIKLVSKLQEQLYFYHFKDEKNVRTDVFRSHQSKREQMPERVLQASSRRQVTDWNGRLLNKRVFDHLQIGCCVRIAVYNSNGAGEGIYVEISKMKDGSLWGTVQDTYRMGEDWIGLPTGSTFAFRFTDIIGIPIFWQPKRIQRKMKPFLDPKQRGRLITGL